MATSKNQGSLVIRMRSSADTQVNLSANGKNVGKTKVAAGKDYTNYRVPLTDKPWSGTVNSMKLDFAGKPGTTVAIDWIRVMP